VKRTPDVHFSLLAASMPRRNSATRCLTRLTHSPSGAFSISFTMRLPTTTASAMRATASAVAASRMPKPTPTGRLQCLRTISSFSRDLVGIEVGRARHALERNVINEAARYAAATCSTRDSGVVGESRKIGSRSAALNTSPRRATLPGNVHRQYAVHAGRLRSLGKGLVAHALDRVGITHQHHRRGRVGLAEFRRHRQHILQSDLVCQGPLGSALDHRTVCHRVGKRHPQFDDVGARFHQRVHQRHGHALAGVAGGDEGIRAFLLCALSAVKVWPMRLMVGSSERCNSIGSKLFSASSAVGRLLIYTLTHKSTARAVRGSGHRTRAQCRATTAWLA
jgi:hypothetical protein